LLFYAFSQILGTPTTFLQPKSSKIAKVAQQQKRCCGRCARNQSAHSHRLELFYGALARKMQNTKKQQRKTALEGLCLRPQRAQHSPYFPLPFRQPLGLSLECRIKLQLFSYVFFANSQHPHNVFTPQGLEKRKEGATRKPAL